MADEVTFQHNICSHSSKSLRGWIQPQLFPTIRYLYQLPDQKGERRYAHWSACCGYSRYTRHATAPSSPHGSKEGRFLDAHAGGVYWRGWENRRYAQRYY